ncbi:Uncharacterised protein [Vibrio cholerae]|nr:Uncharacterised protein [Vibrio cholerae]
MPDVIIGFSSSNGMPFLLHVIPARSKACSTWLPFKPLGLRSTNMRCVSVPPVTMSHPRVCNTSASTFALSITESI